MSRPGAPRPPAWLLGLALVSVPAWLWFTQWMHDDVSGWSRLAAVHAAGDRPLAAGVGTVTVALEVGARPRTVFADRRGATYVELGFDGEQGFWLRSQRSAPSPAVYVPWAAVSRCLFFSAWLTHPELQDLRLTVQHPAFEERCQRIVASRGPWEGCPGAGYMNRCSPAFSPPRIT
jgi:hypothetical protein